MFNSARRKLTRKLFSLSVLLIAFLFLWMPGHKASAGFVCDDNYFLCYSQTFGDPDGSCLQTYEGCLLSHVRYNPEIPVDDCHSDVIYNHCLRGIFPTPAYRPDFSACVAGGDSSEECCYGVMLKYQQDYCSPY
jgi:hypothetical protein